MYPIDGNFALYHPTTLNVVAEVKKNKVTLRGKVLKGLTTLGMAVPFDLKEKYSTSDGERSYISTRDADFSEAFLDFHYPRDLKREGYKITSLEKVPEIIAQRAARVSEIRKRKLEIEDSAMKEVDESPIDTGLEALPAPFEHKKTKADTLIPSLNNLKI